MATPNDNADLRKETLNILRGDFREKSERREKKTIVVDEAAGKEFTVWIGGVISMKTLAKVKSLLGHDDPPLENMVDAIILLAQKPDGSALFQGLDRQILLDEVDPVYIAEAAEWLGTKATGSLRRANETAGEG